MLPDKNDCCQPMCCLSEPAGLAPPSLYLAAAGVGGLTIVDDDGVDSNLQRQLPTGDIGINSDLAAAAVRALNPTAHVTVIEHRLAEPELFSESDLVIDATDNAESRYSLNASVGAQANPW